MLPDMMTLDMTSSFFEHNFELLIFFIRHDSVNFLDITLDITSLNLILDKKRGNFNFELNFLYLFYHSLKLIIEASQPG